MIQLFLQSKNKLNPEQLQILARWLNKEYYCYMCPKIQIFIFKMLSNLMFLIFLFYTDFSLT